MEPPELNSDQLLDALIKSLTAPTPTNQQARTKIQLPKYVAPAKPMTTKKDDNVTDEVGHINADSEVGLLGDGADTVPPALEEKAPSKKIRRRKIYPPLNKIALVPDPAYAANYVGRSIDGMSYAQIFDLAQTTDSNVLMEGPTGSGKTLAVMAYASMRGRAFYSVASSSASEPSQMFGKLLPADGGGFEWVDGPVTDIVRYGGVLLINEINFLPPRIATVLFGLLDSRRTLTLVDHKGEIIRAHVSYNCWCGGSLGDDKPKDFKPSDDCVRRRVLVVADMNPDYRGTQRLNEALLNRFSIKLEWDYDPQVEQQLITSRSLLSFAKKLRDSSGASNMAPVSTNKLQEFERIVRITGNLAFAKRNFFQSFDPRDRQFLQTTWVAFGANIENDYTKKGFIR